MPSTVFGLPLHPLVVHATVVIVPLAALMVLLAVLVPRVRTWAGPLPMGLALVALVLTPLSTSSGENLEAMVGESRLVEEHAELGDQLIWFTAPLFVLAAVFWFLTRRRRTATEAGGADGASGSSSRTSTSSRPKALVTAVGVLAVLAALGTGVQVVRIGHSGAEAVWSGTASSSASSASVHAPADG